MNAKRIVAVIWALLLIALGIIVIAGLHGCSRSISVTDPLTGRVIEYTNVGFDTKIGALDLTRDEDKLTLHVDNYSSEAATAHRALEAVTALTQLLARVPGPVADAEELRRLDRTMDELMLYRRAEPGPHLLVSGAQ